MGHEDETPEEADKRMKEYWADQEKLVEQIVKTDKSLGDILEYIKTNQDKDPMLIPMPDITEKYSKKPPGGGGCVIS